MFPCGGHFLVDSLKLATGKPRLRTQQVHQTLTNLFGNPTASLFWEDQSIEKARLIRHAVVHNGRRMTSDLEKFRNQLLLQDDEVVIYARDTTALFHLLKERVQSFSESLVRHLKAVPNRVVLKKEQLWQHWQMLLIKLLNTLLP